MPQYIGSKDPLLAGDDFDSGWRLTGLADKITGLVFASHTGTLYIEQSIDQINADISTDYAVTAADGKGFSEELLAPYVRVRFVNDGTNQTAFRLAARYASSGPR